MREKIYAKGSNFIRALAFGWARLFGKGYLKTIIYTKDERFEQVKDGDDMNIILTRRGA